MAVLRKIGKAILIIIVAMILVVLVGLAGLWVLLKWDDWDLGSHTSRAPAISCRPGQSPKLVAADNGIYLNGYIGGINWNGDGRGAGFYRKAIPAFETLAGKKLAIVNVVDFWFGGIEFPVKQVKAVWESGAVPSFSLAPMSAWDYASAPDPVYSLQKFIDGAFDEELTQFFREAKETGIPLMLSFGGETTAGWPWSGTHNGGGTRDGYGDPTYPDGPERYRDAYRHTIDLSRKVGAKNISWGYGTAIEFFEPGTPEYQQYYGDWNKDEFYYPGDEYIDWLAAGVWGYYAPFFPEWREFRGDMDKLYAQLSRISQKAWIAMEMGVQHDPEKGDMARWIRDAYGDLKSGRYPRVKSISWWGERSTDETTGKPANTAIDTTPEVLAAFRESVADPLFLENVSFACIDE